MSESLYTTFGNEQVTNPRDKLVKFLETTQLTFPLKQV